MKMYRSCVCEHRMVERSQPKGRRIAEHISMCWPSKAEQETWRLSHDFIDLQTRCQEICSSEYLKRMAITSLRLRQNWPISSKSSMTFWLNMAWYWAPKSHSGWLWAVLWTRQTDRRRSNPASTRQDPINRVIQVPWCGIDLWFDRDGRHWCKICRRSWHI